MPPSPSGLTNTEEQALQAWWNDQSPNSRLIYIKVSWPGKSDTYYSFMSRYSYANLSGNFRKALFNHLQRYNYLPDTLSPPTIQVVPSTIAVPVTASAPGVTEPAEEIAPAPPAQVISVPAPKIREVAAAKPVPQVPPPPANPAINREMAELQSYIPPKVENYYPRKFEGMDDVDIITRAIQARLNILLLGATGEGKTHVYRLVAHNLKIPYFRANFNGATTPDDLIGQWVPTSDSNRPGSFDWVNGGLTKLVKYGGLFVADEMNFAKPDMLAFLNSLLDTERTMVIYPHEGERLTAHKDFVFAAAMNPVSYLGTRPLNMALQDRFDVVLNYETDYKLLAKIIPDKRLLELKEAIDNSIKQGNVRGVLSTRGLQQFLNNKKLFGDKVAANIMANKFYGAGIETIRNTIDVKMGI